MVSDVTEVPAVYNPDLEELISLLDPDRDYGERTHEQVVQEVRAGALTIQRNPSEVITQPFLTDARTGKRIKGSGMAVNKRGYTKQSEFNHKWFLERCEEDREKVYRSLMKAIDRDEPDPRALKLWLEYAIGAPQKMLAGGASTDAIKALLDAAKSMRTEVVIDATTGEAHEEMVDVT